MTFTAPNDHKNSFIDGMFVNIFGTLTVGAFLTVFALYLGMNECMIGLLGAMPFITTVFQVPASYFVQKSRLRKNYCIIWTAVAGLLWIPILMVVLLPFSKLTTTIFSILVLIYLKFSDILKFSATTELRSGRRITALWRIEE